MVALLSIYVLCLIYCTWNLDYSLGRVMELDLHLMVHLVGMVCVRVIYNINIILPLDRNYKRGCSLPRFGLSFKSMEDSFWVVWNCTSHGDWNNCGFLAYDSTIVRHILIQIKGVFQARYSAFTADRRLDLKHNSDRVATLHFHFLCNVLVWRYDDNFEK